MNPQVIAGPNSGYLPQLDALRAVAVTMVIFSHWAGYHGNLWEDSLPWFNGEVGVQLFFVISGLLITGILLDERDRAHRSGICSRHVLRQFYVRRFLRIFPVFYATLAVTFLLGHPDVRQSLPWHASYLSNLYFALRGDYLGDVSHFWSLAVEEQFYLVWPFLILFLPRIALPIVIAFLIGSSVVFRYFMTFVLEANEVTTNVLPISSFDALGAGALLALTARMPGGMAISSHIHRVAFWCGLSYILVKSVLPIPESMEAHAMFVARVILIPALAGVVLLFSHGVKHSRLLLEAKPLLYLGKVSYGLYLFHFFIPGAVLYSLAIFGVAIESSRDYWLLLFLNACTLIFAASMSWHFLEQPINNLKRHFPYSSATIPASIPVKDKER